MSKLFSCAFFFLFTAFLNANSSSSISSKKAVYNGNTLLLKGEVCLDHPFAALESDSAWLEKESKEAPFSSIRLKDNVLITLKEEGEIRCHSADFDLLHLTATLSPKTGEFIHFIRKNNKHSSLPFSFSSHEAKALLKKEGDEIKITEILANSCFHMNYGELFALTADSALYSSEASPHLTAFPNCVMTSSNALIEAKKVEIFPQLATIVLLSPKGELNSGFFTNQESPLFFSCNRLTWEDPTHLLTLTGDILLSERNSNHLTCAHQMQIRQKKQNEKWMVYTLTTHGKTALSYSDAENEAHTLTCFGSLCLDKEALLLTLSSPKDPSPEQQIQYLYKDIRLYADSGELQYTDIGEGIKPKNLFLNGHVYLTSGLETSSDRCALADAFSYIPLEKKIILTAKKGENVLFWDSAQDLSISAKEVHITRGASPNTDLIKGVGSVRFAFSAAESALFKKVFSLYQNKKEETGS